MKEKSKPNYVLKSYIISNHQQDLKFENKISYYRYIQEVIEKQRCKYHEIYGNNFEKIDKAMARWINENEKLSNYMNSPHYGICHLYEKLRYLGEIDDKEIEDYFLMNECHKINNASRMRTKRLENKINKMANTNNAIFLTLTFNDKVFDKMSDITRKRYIKKFLKENCIEYVANIDYGKKNEREHYHAVVVPINEKLDSQAYRDIFYNSNINFERIRIDNNYKALSKYVNKLTLHAIKETTRKNCVIYSRQ